MSSVSFNASMANNVKFMLIPIVSEFDMSHATQETQSKKDKALAKILSGFADLIEVMQEALEEDKARMIETEMPTLSEQEMASFSQLIRMFSTYLPQIQASTTKEEFILFRKFYCAFDEFLSLNKQLSEPECEVDIDLGIDLAPAIETSLKVAQGEICHK